MAGPKSRGWFSCHQICRTGTSDDETPESPETPETPGTPLTHEGYLQPTVKCLQQARTMAASLNFNDGQCQYLVDKLEVAVQSVRPMSIDYADLTTLAHYFQVFKFLFSLATEVESFIQICCKVEWIQAAASMTNVSKHVSFLGFNLEVFRVIFSKCTQQNGTRALTPSIVGGMSKAEEKTVKYKASLDELRLLRKLEDFIGSSSSGKGSEDNDRRLARILVKILRQSYARSTPFMLSLFKLGTYSTNLEQQEKLGRGSFATVYKGIWLGVTLPKKTFDGPQDPSFKTELANFARLSHPNVVRLFGFETDVRKCSIVMELMDGDLCQLIDERFHRGAIDSSPFTILEGIDIMHQIGEGVLYLHE